VDGVAALPILMTARHLRARAHARAGQRPRRRGAAARARSRGHGLALRRALGGRVLLRVRADGARLRPGLCMEHARTAIAQLDPDDAPAQCSLPLPHAILASLHAALGGGVHVLSTRAWSEPPHTVRKAGARLAKRAPCL